MISAPMHDMLQQVAADFRQSAFTPLSEPTLTINPSGSAAEMGSLNCDFQTSLYVIGTTSESFYY